MFMVKESLSEQEVQSGLNWITRDGIASQAMATLCGGAFLVAFALKLGASNVIIGLLASIGPLFNLLQIPSIYLVERIRNRRAITVIAVGVARITWLFIVLIPFLFPGNVGLFLLMAAIVVTAAFGPAANCAWNSWMRDIVPEKIRGQYFGKRLLLATVAGVVLSLAAAAYLDIWKRYLPEHELQGYSILFFFGLLAGLFGTFCIAKIPEPQMPTPQVKHHFFKLLMQPFRDANFRKLIAFLCSWNFAVNLAAPFFIVYMLERLELKMSIVIALTVLSQIVTALFLKLWGKFTDRYSNKSVLQVCSPIFLFSILAWTFTTMPDKHFLTFPLLIAIHIAIGIASAGIALATGNISLKLAPKGEATAYLATCTVCNSVAAGIAPIVGGSLAHFLSKTELALNLSYKSATEQVSLTALNFQHWDFFFALAFFLGLYALHRLTLIKEVGEVDDEVVFNAFVSQIKTRTRILSSVEGLRQMVTFPRDIITNLFK